RGGLAGAGLRLADQVAPGQHRRDRLLLDRRRRLVPALGDRPQDRSGQPQALERHRVSLFVVFWHQSPPAWHSIVFGLTIVRDRRRVPWLSTTYPARD